MRNSIKVNSTLFYLVIFFLFVGEFKIFIGDSSISIPIGFPFILLIFFLQISRSNISITIDSVILVAVFILGLFTVLLSDINQIPRAIAAMIPLAVCIVTLLSTGKLSIDIEKAYKAFAYGGSILAIWVYFGFFQSLSIDGGYYEKKILIETYLGRSNYLAAFLFFLAAIFLNKNKILFLFFVGAIFATMSRGGIIVTSLFILQSIWINKRYKWIKFPIVVCAILLFVYFFITNDLHQLLLNGDSFKVPDSFENRILLWNFSFDLLRNSPLFGVGPNGFRTAVEAAGNVEDVWGAHNSILLLWLNYGITGLLLYLTYLHHIYIELKKATSETIFRSIKTAFVFLLIFSLFEPLVGSVSFDLLLTLIFVMAKNFNRGNRKIPEYTMNVKSNIVY